MVDSTKLNYLSEWDIDQLEFSGEVDGISLPGNTTSLSFVTLKNLSLGYPPVVDGSFQVSGDTVWRQFGDPTSSALVNLQTFIVSTPIAVSLGYYNFNVGAVVVNVRYYIWTDKINY